MKVAVTYENGEVFPHFGRTSQFKVYEIGEATCDHHEHEGHGEHGCGQGGCH